MEAPPPHTPPGHMCAVVGVDQALTAPTPGSSLATTVVVPFPAAARATAQFSRSPVALAATMNSPAETSQCSLAPAAISAVDSLGKVKAPSICAATSSPDAALVTGTASMVPRMKGTPLVRALGAAICTVLPLECELFIVGFLHKAKGGVRVQGGRTGATLHVRWVTRPRFCRSRGSRWPWHRTRGDT
ncbi:hypothetical protein STPYR_12782 [uncultured Stenotrophomonas sp.]|uniref:Uncharacterized protein n=1 Tax=uncultured Stenotrophomonas sp. TaxID=165438 RepID=A0A1Y5Q6A7_9GAMM|nr:hypothetical protein STPYR_12782 [uncultured Stenotrophomonas sp.]